MLTHYQCASPGDTAGRTGADAPEQETISPNATPKRLKVSAKREEQPEPQPVPQEPSSSSELAAVDFMSSDEEVYQPGAALGTRFDSSEDEEEPSLAKQQHSGSAAASKLPATSHLSSLSDHSASDHNEQAHSSSETEAGVDREVPQGEQLEQEMAGGADVEGIEEAAQEEADTREGASESSGASSDAADAAAEVEGSPQGSDSPAEPLTSLGDDMEVEDPSEPSESEEDAPFVTAMEASADAKPLSPDLQPAAPQEDTPHLQNEQQLPAASQGEGGVSLEDQADQLRLQREGKTLEGVSIGSRSSVVCAYCSLA